MNETSGTRADISGSNTLSNTGSVGSATGKISNAALFSGSNHLSISDNTALSSGDVDFTLSGWVYMGDKSVSRTIASKYLSSTSQIEYLFWYNQSVDRFQFYVSPSGTGTGTATINADALGSPSINTWYYVVAWHDSVSNTINIQVNNGTVNSSAHSTGVFDGTASFSIGAANNGASALMNGRIDAVGVWKRVLSAGERTSLYNSGNGVETFAPSSPTSLVANGENAQVALSWTAPSSYGSAVSDYIVEYKLSADSSWTTFSDGTSATASAVVTGLTNGASYDFRVSAINSIGTSAVSSTSTATPTLPTVSGSPTSLITIVGDATTSLSWMTPVSNGGSSISDYIVEYKLTSNPSWSTFSDGVSTTTSATVTGLTNSASYDFRVSAVNGIGTSTPSGTSAATPIGLSNSLVGFWNLNETSGTRADSTTGSNLADTGSVGSAAGKINTAANFSGSNYLSVADNARLSMGDIDFTLSGWVYMGDKTDNRTVVSKYDSNGVNQREYLIQYNLVNDRFQFFVSSDGSSGASIFADALGSPSINTWYYVVAWHDSVSNTINIQVNNGTVNSSAYSSGVFNGTAAFALGSASQGISSLMNGRIDAVGVWKRVLNSVDRTTLYNAGSGLEYASLNASPSINIISPSSYQVIQRNGSNQASIAITGTYGGTPTSIEASWNGGVYATIVTSPSGGIFSGTLLNQNAGQGTLTVRFTNDTSISNSKSYVGIGDIFIVAGQSNAMGAGTNNQAYSNPTYKATMFGNDDQWKELVDPLDDYTNQVDLVSRDAPADGATIGGTIYMQIATRFLASQNVPIAFVPAARGATAISQWQPGGNLSDPATLFGSMYRRILAVGGAKAILWIQGETDASNGNSTATYQSQLNTFIDTVYTNQGIRTVVAQIGNRYGGATSANADKIRLAQKNIWATNTNAIQGPTLYDIPTDDGVHYRTDEALTKVGDRFWAAISKYFYGGTDGTGPQLSSATYDSARTTILLNFTDTNLPVTLLSGTGYITVKGNGSAVSISSVSVSGGTATVNLSTAAALPITVSIGSGVYSNYTTPEPALLDSSTYDLPAEFSLDTATTLYDPDITNPSVSLTAPANAATVAGSSVSIIASASDNIGVVGVQFKLDGSNLQSEDTTSPYGIAWDSTTVSDGAYTLSAVVRDAAGNTATASSFSVTVDNTAPVRSAGVPSGTLVFGTTGTNISLSTNETATCKYSTSAATAYGSMTSFSTTANTTHSSSVTGLTNGTSYLYYVKCADAQANTNATDYTISFSVATPTEPSLPPSTPPQQTVVGFIAPRTTIPSCAPGHRFNSNTGAPCPSSAPTIPSTPTSFTRDLYPGMTGPDVTTLQRYLNTNGFIIAPAGPGSPGNETAYFGLATKAALRKLQLANSIRSTGNLGPVTRKVIEGR